MSRSTSTFADRDKNDTLMYKTHDLHWPNGWWILFINKSLTSKWFHQVDPLLVLHSLAFCGYQNEHVETLDLVIIDQQKKPNGISQSKIKKQSKIFIISTMKRQATLKRHFSSVLFCSMKRQNVDSPFSSHASFLDPLASLDHSASKSTVNGRVYLKKSQLSSSKIFWHDLNCFAASQCFVELKITKTIL